MLARRLNHSDSRGGVCYFIYVCMCTNDVYFFVPCDGVPWARTMEKIGGMDI